MALWIAASTTAGAVESGALSGLSSPPSVHVPLDVSLTTPGATWVDVAMGKLDQPANTFWQLFVLPAGSSHWSLVTPPGVADNGGLVSVASGSTLVTGFDPSALIRFSPVAATNDGGRSWTQGVIDQPLAAVPDALASSSRGAIAALAAGSGGTVVSAASDLSKWQRIVDSKELAATGAGRACALGALSALSFSASGELLVAGSCSRMGTVGILEEAPGGWRLAGPPLPASLARSTTSVLRLRDWEGGVSALIAARSHEGTFLVGTLLHAGGAWSEPVRLSLARGQAIAASAVSADGGLAVLLSGRRGPVAEVLEAGSDSWASIPHLPPLTAAIGFETGGDLDALAVNGDRLSVYRLVTGGAWQRTEVTDVAIQYGSSS